MDVQKISDRLLEIKEVEILGQKIDFRFNVTTSEMTYLPSAWIGKSFLEVGDQNRYSDEVRKILKQIEDRFFVAKKR
jgi:hypothetical protein